MIRIPFVRIGWGPIDFNWFLVLLWETIQNQFDSTRIGRKLDGLAQLDWFCWLISFFLFLLCNPIRRRWFIFVRLTSSETSGSFPCQCDLLLCHYCLWTGTWNRLYSELTLTEVSKTTFLGTMTVGNVFSSQYALQVSQTSGYDLDIWYCGWSGW